MRVLQLISSKGFFGAENIVLQLALELKNRKNISPLVCLFENTRSSNIDLYDIFNNQNISVSKLHCRGKMDIHAIFKLRKIIESNKIDIIHSHGYKANIYSFFSTIRSKIPRISTCHNWISNEPKLKYYSKLDQYFLRYFSHIAAVSDEVKAKIIASGISQKNISVVKNGISLHAFASTCSNSNICKDLNIQNNALIIGNVARFSAEKAHELLIKAFIEINKEFPESILLLVGDGPLKGSLERKYNHPSIIFAGQRKDVDRFYACMDVFVLPSLTEGLPLVLLEAMAAKVPVIASCVGAIPNVLKKGDCGILIEPGNSKDLKKALIYTFRNKKKVNEMALSAYERVEKHYSSKKMCNEYVMIYQEAFDGIRC